MTHNDNKSWQERFRKDFPDSGMGISSIQYNKLEPFIAQELQQARVEAIEEAIEVVEKRKKPPATADKGRTARRVVHICNTTIEGIVGALHSLITPTN